MEIVVDAIKAIIKVILTVLGFAAWFIAFVLGVILGTLTDLAWWVAEGLKPLREKLGLPGIVEDHDPTKGLLPVAAWVADKVTTTWLDFNKWLWGGDE